MGKIHNRAAFFSNPKTADGLNSKERRKLKRQPLHEEWEAYQNRKNSDGRQTRKEENRTTRRVILTDDIKQGQQSGSGADDLHSQKSTTTPSCSTEEVFNIHVDEEEYNTFVET